jgi:membrane protease YdiL (CAAX protease family)
LPSVSTTVRRDLEPERRHARRVVPLVVVAYAGAAALGVGIGVARHAPNVLVCTPWVAMPRALGHASSLGLGVVLAMIVVIGTRHLVRTRVWAERLHRELRPAARALAPSTLPWIALASGIGEEVLFRGALVPALGVVVSSAAFGLLHQTRGPARVTWMVFAAAMGLAFGALFRSTGSLLGPIVAHVVINAINLRFLVEHDPRRIRRLGGLLAKPRK